MLDAKRMNTRIYIYIYENRVETNLKPRPVESRPRYEIISKRAWLLLNCGRSCLTLLDRVASCLKIITEAIYVPFLSQRIAERFARIRFAAFPYRGCLCFSTFFCNRFEVALTKKKKKTCLNYTCNMDRAKFITFRNR